jgi:hypothetical protein
MAVVNLQSQGIGLIPSKNLGGGSGVVPMMEGVEAAAQSWKKGAILIESSGKVAIASADPTSAILGVAAGDASGVTDAKCLFYPARPGMVFEATYEDQNSENHALVQGDLYTNHALQVDGNGIWYVDENDTTNTAVVIVGHKDALGTTRARVFVEFEVDKTSWE